VATCSIELEASNLSPRRTSSGQLWRSS
jgi:hypothetical protein